ncbi:probable protein phosphatase 2C 60 [Tanacetum coccineum]
MGEGRIASLSRGHVWKSVRYGVSKELDMAYWGFLGVGTTLDIFQNIIFIPYLEYGVLSLSGYGVLSFILCGLWKNEWLDDGETMGKTDDDGVMMVSSGCVQTTKRMKVNHNEIGSGAEMEVQLRGCSIYAIEEMRDLIQKRTRKQANHAECVIAAMSGVCTPKTKDGENGSGRHGLSSMQGWHATMEDDHAAHPDLDSSASFFDVYDGHEGKVVAKFCAKFLHQQVLKQEAYPTGNIETFHAAHPDLDSSASFFDVYDGYEGKVVAKFCAKFLHQQVLKQEAYPTGNIETFVQKSFLRCDRGSDMVPERRRKKSKGGRVGLRGGSYYEKVIDAKDAKMGKIGEHKDYDIQRAYGTKDYNSEQWMHNRLLPQDLWERI